MAPGAVSVSVSGVAAARVSFSCFDRVSKRIVGSEKTAIELTAVAGGSIFCVATIKAPASAKAAREGDQVAQLKAVWSVPSDAVVGSNTAYSFLAYGDNNAASIPAANVVIRMEVDPRLDVFNVTFYSNSTSSTAAPLVVACTPSFLNAQGRVTYPNVVFCNITSLPPSVSWFVDWQYYAPVTIVGTSDITVAIIVNATTTTPQQNPDEPAYDVKTLKLIIRADVSVDISGPTEITPGVQAGNGPEKYLYPIRVCNAGPANAVNVVAVFRFPSQFSMVGFQNEDPVNGVIPTCVFANADRLVTCSGFNLTSPNGGGQSCALFVQTVNVLSDAAGGPNNVPVTIRANVGSDTSDNVLLNNEKLYDVLLTPLADMSITKSGDSLVVAGGAPAIYSILVFNGGPSVAYGASMSDFDFPIGFRIISVTTTRGNCLFSNPGNGASARVSCTFGDLPVGARENGINIIITYDVPRDFTPNIFGPVNVTEANGLPNVASTSSLTQDNLQSNNRDPAYVGVYALTDLFVSKTCIETITFGYTVPFDYVLTVGNKNFSDARDVNVLDRIPEQFTPQSSSVTVSFVNGASASCSIAAGVSTCPMTVNGRSFTVVCQPILQNLINCSVSRLPPLLGAAQFTLKVAVLPKSVSVDTIVDNVVTVTSSSFENLQATGADNRANCTTVIRPPPDLTIVKWAPLSVTVGLTSSPTYFYTIFVINNGPTGAENVGFRDVVNSNFTVQTAGITFSAGFPSNSCSSSSGNNIVCNFGALASGSTIEIKIPFTVNSDLLAQTVENCANVTALLDRNLDNNRACNQTAVVNGVVLDVNLVNVTLCAGATVTTQATIRNAGPADATSVTYVSQLPMSVGVAVIKSVSWLSGSGVTTPLSPTLCSVSAGNLISCTFGTVPNQGTVTVTYEFTAPKTLRTSTFPFSGTASTTSIHLSTSLATETKFIVVNECADITVVKTGESKVIAGTSFEVVGQNYRYLLTVTNIGVSSAFDVKAVDTLPFLFNAVSATTAGGVCNITTVDVVVGAITESRSRVSCAWDGLFSSPSVVTVVFNVDSNHPRKVVENCVDVTTVSTETNYANNRNCTPTLVVNQADIVVTKKNNTVCIPADGTTQGTFTITVNNRGPSRAWGVELRDVVESPFVFVTGSIVTVPSDLAARCRFEIGTVVCPIGQLSANPSGADQVEIRFNVFVPRNIVSQTAFNTATATSQCSPDVVGVDACVTNAQEVGKTANNVATVPQCVNANAVLTIEKKCEANPIVSGKPGPFRFTITVTNNGPSFAYNAVVLDTFRSEFTNLQIESQSNLVCNFTVTNQLKCTAAALPFPAAGAVNVVITYTPKPDSIETVIVPNTASVSSDQSVTVFSLCNTTIVPPPNIVISKFGPASILIDDVSTKYFYTVVITNLGLGNAENVIFQDSADIATEPVWEERVVTRVPAGGDGATNICTTSGRYIRCEFGSLVQGGTITVVFPFRVPDTDRQSITNCANATIALELFGQRINEACNMTTLSRGANLSVRKESQDVCAGASQTYSIFVFNAGPATASTANLIDVLPAQFIPGSNSSIVVSTNVGTRPSSQCWFNGQTLRCAFGSVPAFESINVTFSYSVNPRTAAGTVRNFVNVTSTTVDLISSDNIDRFFDNRILACAVILPKKTGPPVVVAGSATTYSYTLRFTNTGSSSIASGNAIVTDTLPISGLRITNVAPTGVANCTKGGSAPTVNEFINCVWNEIIDPGQSREVVVSFQVLADTKAQSKENCVFISGSSDGQLRSDCNLTTVVTEADLAVTKEHELPCIVAGDGVGKYTITVRNNGPSDGYSVVLTDNVPADFRFVGRTITDNTFGTNVCSFPTVGTLGGTITCNIAQFPTSGFVRFIYEVSVPSSASNKTGILNTVSVTSGCSVATCSSPTDKVSINDSATVSSCIVARSDLRVVKTVDSAATPGATVPIVAGDGVTHSFLIAVSNDGPSDAYNVTVTDTQFIGGTILSIRSSTGAATCSKETLSCFYAVLISKQTDTIILDFTVPPSQPCQVYVNKATITSALTFEIDIVSNSATVNVPVVRRNDLVIDKIGLETATDGTSGTFTISFVNKGPSDATDVVFTDSVPVPLTLASVSLNSSICGFVGQLLTCHFGTIAPNAAPIVFSYTYFVAPNAGITNPNQRQVTNRACVNTTGARDCETELVPSNNCDSVPVAVGCESDLKITKTDNVDVITAGDGKIYTFTIDVTNIAGPSDSRVVVVNDFWPKEYSPLNGQDNVIPFVNQTGGWDCVVVSRVNNSFVCTLAPIPVGQTVRITVPFRVLASVPEGFVSNTVTVAGSCKDINATNNVATDKNKILNFADIGIVKDDGECIVVAGGESLFFTFIATNKGPSDAKNVVLSDTFPTPQYNLIGSPVVTNHPEVECKLTSTSAGNGFECKFPTIAVGVVYEITQQYNVPQEILPQTDVQNCAFFVNPLVVTDNNLTDNKSCDNNTIVTRADLEITKTLTPGTEGDCIVAGDLRVSVYTVTVTNKGPSVSRNVIVNEYLPVGIVLSSTPRCKFGSSFSQCCSRISTSNNYTCALQDMAKNAVVSIYFEFTVSPSTPAGVITNYATTQSTASGSVAATFDPELCNNNVTLSSLVCAVSDLSVTKTDGVTQVVAGDGVVYKYNITGCNAGPSTANRVRFEDLWPLAEAGFIRREIIGASNCTSTGSNFECDVGTLQPGQCTSICVLYVVEPCALACQACNTVVIDSLSRDPNRNNNQAVDCNDVKTRADLNVTKTDGVTQVVAGDGKLFTYTIRVCNAGPSCAQKVTLVDHFPKDVYQIPNSIRIVTSGSLTGSCINEPNPATDFSCTLLTLNPNTCLTVYVNYSVPATAATCSVHNVAIVSSTTFDPFLCNNVASDTNALIENATLSIKKETSSAVVTLGNYGPQYFTITVANAGPSVARDVVVTDVWPFGLCQYPETIQILPSGGTAITTGSDIMAPLGDIAPGTNKRIIVPYSVCQRATAGVVVNKASAFSPTDEQCRDANVTVEIRSNPSKREETHEVEAVHEIANRGVTEVQEIKKEVVVKESAPSTDMRLAAVNVEVKLVALDDTHFSIEVVNTAAADVRVTKVTMAAVAGTVGTVDLDLTRVGGHVVSTTCAAFAERRLSSLWSEKCVVQVSDKLTFVRVAVGGISQQQDGAHMVMGSAAL